MPRRGVSSLFRAREFKRLSWGMKRRASRRIKAGKIVRKRVPDRSTSRRHTPGSVPELRKRLESLERELLQRTDDLTESLEQQTATREVLKVISSSPGELEQVFQAVLQNATHLCEAKFGILFQSEGDAFRTSAMYNAPPALTEARRREPLFRPAPNTALGRMGLIKRPVRVADMLAEPGYLDPPPGYSKPKIAAVADARSVVAVPMLKDDELVGAIVIYRQEVRPFTDKQIDLVQNFAAQAVIAIENTRLLHELRQRTEDLTESLEQQTATAEILRVISTSEGQLEPVFTAILENATRICRANFGGLFSREDGRLRILAQVRLPEKFLDAARSGKHRPGPRNAITQLFETGQAVHVADYREHVAYQTRDPMAVIGVEFAGIRTLLNVPMIKDGRVIGFFGIFRQEVEAFTDKQIELVQNFAAQAVIAIENTRLSTSCVPQTISAKRWSSRLRRARCSRLFKLAGRAQPVFDAML